MINKPHQDISRLFNCLQGMESRPKRKERRDGGGKEKIEKKKSGKRDSSTHTCPELAKKKLPCPLILRLVLSHCPSGDSSSRVTRQRYEGRRRNGRLPADASVRPDLHVLATSIYHPRRVACINCCISHLSANNPADVLRLG